MKNYATTYINSAAGKAYQLRNKNKLHTHNSPQTCQCFVSDLKLHPKPGVGAAQSRQGQQNTLTMHTPRGRNTQGVSPTPTATPDAATAPHAAARTTLPPSPPAAPPVVAARGSCNLASRGSRPHTTGGDASLLHIICLDSVTT